MSNHEEKVMAEWPAHLRDDAQYVTPLPTKGNTDFLIVRFQGENNREHLARVVETLHKRNMESDDVILSYVSVKQRYNRWQPKNSWTVIRGAFDWLLAHGQAVMDAGDEQVQKRQAERDQRRRDRYAR